MHPFTFIFRALAGAVLAALLVAAPLHAAPVTYELDVDIVGLGIQARNEAGQAVSLINNADYLDLTFHNASVSNIRIDDVHQMNHYTGQLTALTGRIDGTWDATANTWLIHGGQISYTVTNDDLTENVFQLDINEGARYTNRLFAALSENNQWSSDNLGGIPVHHTPLHTGHFSLIYEPGALGFDPRGQLKITTAMVPEPASVSLIGLGLAMLAWPRRRSPVVS